MSIVYMSSFDKLSEQTPNNIFIINSLNDIKYGEFRDNDTHYERADSERKYYRAMTDIQLVDKDSSSIIITFDSDYFQKNRNGEYMKSQSQQESEFAAMINENETFVAGCNAFSLHDEPDAERIPVKQIHVLRYEGITEKEEIQYYGFTHEAGYLPNNIECKFPEIIQSSLDVDFDISETNFYGDVWDHNWG